MNEVKKIDDWLYTAQVVCTKTDGKTKYDFNKFTFPSKFTLKIYRHDFMPQEAEDDQQELQILINKLNNDYNPKSETKINEKENNLKSAKTLFCTRESIINAFKKRCFSVHRSISCKKESDEELDEEIDTTDMPDLETEESAAERRKQKGQELKILTPNQTLSRLPISLAQSKAGNKSEKLKNEIRQLLYSLYRTKNIYNNLINAI